MGMEDIGQAVLMIREEVLSYVLEQASEEQRNALNKKNFETSDCEDRWGEPRNFSFTEDGWRFWIDRHAYARSEAFEDILVLLEKLTDNTQVKTGDKIKSEDWAYIRIPVYQGAGDPTFAIYADNGKYKVPDCVKFGIEYGVGGYLDYTNKIKKPRIHNFPEDECRIAIAISFEYGGIKECKEDISQALFKYMDKYTVERGPAFEKAGEFWFLANLPIKSGEEMSWQTIAEEITNYSCMQIFPHMGPLRNTDPGYVPMLKILDIGFDKVFNNPNSKLSIVLGEANPEYSAMHLELRRVFYLTSISGEKRNIETVKEKKETVYQISGGGCEYIVPPRYIEAGDFKDGLALIQTTEDYKYGYIDSSGREAIHPQFDNAYEFGDGMARVGNESYQFGYIDTSGKLIIPFQYDMCGDFCNGLAPVRVGDKWGFIDKTGNLVIEPQYAEAHGFSEGLAGVMLKKNKWGFIDHKGKQVIKAQYNWVGTFRDGLARARIEGRGSSFIDKNGEAVISGESYLSFSDFNEGRASVEPLDAGNRAGYIDKTGQLVIPPLYYFASDFHEDLAHVQPELSGINAFMVPPRGDTLLYIDVNGAIRFKLENVKFPQDFCEGYAGVSVYDDKGNPKFGLIDKNGKFVIEPQFDAIGDVHNGVVPVKVDDMWGLVKITCKN